SQAGVIEQCPDSAIADQSVQTSLLMREPLRSAWYEQRHFHLPRFTITMSKRTPPIPPMTFTAPARSTIPGVGTATRTNPASMICSHTIMSRRNQYVLFISPTAVSSSKMSSSTICSSLRAVCRVPQLYHTRRSVVAVLPAVIRLRQSVLGRPRRAFLDESPVIRQRVPHVIDFVRRYPRRLDCLRRLDPPRQVAAEQRENLLPVVVQTRQILQFLLHLVAVPYHNLGPVRCLHAYASHALIPRIHLDLSGNLLFPACRRHRSNRSRSILEHHEVDVADLSRHRPVDRIRSQCRALHHCHFVMRSDGTRPFAAALARMVNDNGRRASSSAQRFEPRTGSPRGCNRFAEEDHGRPLSLTVIPTAAGQGCAAGS